MYALPNSDIHRADTPIAMDFNSFGTILENKIQVESQIRINI